MSGKLEALKPQRKIELYSGNYFAACTLGGVIGMALFDRGPLIARLIVIDSMRADTYYGYAFGSGE